MKKFYTTVCLLILSNLAKAADLGLSVNQFEKFTNKNNVVAINGTGTCDVVTELKIQNEMELGRLTIKQLRTIINKESSVERKQEILDLIERALLDENSIQN